VKQVAESQSIVWLVFKLSLTWVCVRLGCCGVACGVRAVVSGVPRVWGVVAVLVYELLELSFGP